MIQGPVVTILVGPDKTEITAHKALLCHHSHYFRGALTNSFIESKTGIIELKDQDPESFQHVLLWMYRGDVSPVTFDGNDRAVFSCLQLCKTYYCADFLQVEQLLQILLVELNYMFDHYREMKNVPLDSELIIDIYENTPDTSPLRERVIEELVRLICKKDSGVAVSSFNECFQCLDDFGVKVVVGLQQRFLEKLAAQEAEHASKRPRASGGTPDLEEYPYWGSLITPLTPYYESVPTGQWYQNISPTLISPSNPHLAYDPAAPPVSYTAPPVSYTVPIVPTSRSQPPNNGQPTQPAAQNSAFTRNIRLRNDLVRQNHLQRQARNGSHHYNDGNEVIDLE